MPVYIALLRGVNLAKNNRMKMEDLRALFESLKFTGVHTYIQSGNIVFRAPEQDAAKLASRIETAIDKAFGFRPPVILRDLASWRRAVQLNPYAGRADVEPNKLLVHFLAADPGDSARLKARAVPCAPEELHVFDRELYIYYVSGMARPKLNFASLERALGVTGSGRNWNSVVKLLEMAENVEAEPAPKRRSR